MADNPPQHVRVARSVFGVSLNDILRLLIASAIVGLVMRFFGLDPRRLWSGIFSGLGDFVAAWPRAIASMFDGLGPALTYVLYGAAIVIPIWLALRVLGLVFGKR